MAMLTTTLKEIHLAATQGFCAGVASAVDVVDRALEKYGTLLYVRHKIVHNTTVIDGFKRQGVVFIEELDEVPSDNVVIFSAHGTAPEEFDRARERNLKVIDATCPLVTRVHKQAVRFSSNGVQTVLSSPSIDTTAAVVGSGKAKLDVMETAFKTAVENALYV